MKKKITSASRIIIIGGHEQAVLGLEFLVKKKFNLVLCICRNDDNGKDTFFPSLIKVAKNRKVPYLKTINVNSNHFFKKVKSFNPDLVLSLQNNYILDKKWINYFEPRKGIINIHFSPLPKYSGYWPEMWAIWNKEKIHGVTLHYISDKIDTGNIILQKKFKINKNENRFTLYSRCSLEGFKLLKNCISKITEKKTLGKKQNLKIRSFYSKKMPNNGILDLDWNQKKIDRFIRSICFPGFPGVKIKVANQSYNIIFGELPDHEQIQVFSKNTNLYPDNYVITKYINKKK